MTDVSGHGILICLDAILDTRLGAMGVVDPEIGMEIGTSRAYAARMTDVMSDIDSRFNQEMFRKTYLSRGENVLRHSIMTDIPYLIGTGIDKMLPQFDNGLIGGEIFVHVNTYPFKVSDDTKRLIEQGVKRYIPDPVRVTCIYMDMYNLTPSLLNSKYKEWYSYNIEQWISIHEKAILGNLYKNILITLPRISTTGKIPDDPDLDPFSAVELVFSSFFRCKHISASYFSYNHDLALVEKSLRQSLSANQSSGDNGDSP